MCDSSSCHVLRMKHMTNEKKKSSGWKRKAAIVALGLAAIVGGYELVAYYTAPDFSSLKERITAAYPEDYEKIIRMLITDFENDRETYNESLDYFKNNEKNIIKDEGDAIKKLKMDPNNLTRSHPKTSTFALM